MLETLIERFGEPAVGAGLGLTLGVLFGIFAQRSRFCMRSAAIEVWRGSGGDRLPLWLLAVGVAIIGTQALFVGGYVTADTIRQLNGGGSYSGAVIGGLLFGAGMILTRGCVSRLMVLSGAGNLRAVATLAVFIGVAYATMKGGLGEARAYFAGIYPVEGAGKLDLLRSTGASAWAGLALGGAITLAALWLGVKRGLSVAMALGGVAIGLAVTATYGLTAALNAVSFDPQPVRGLSFIAPVVNTISGVLPSAGGFKLDFDAGLIPGVLVGALAAALVSRSFQIQWFGSGLSTLRYIAGAVLMGFGGVLAGGCSMGNGVSGFAIYAIPALISLLAMWVGAGLADLAFDRPARAIIVPEAQDLSGQNLPGTVKA